jgi:hypothetical protein
MLVRLDRFVNRKLEKIQNLESGGATGSFSFVNSNQGLHFFDRTTGIQTNPLTTNFEEEVKFDDRFSWMDEVPELVVGARAYQEPVPAIV